MHAFSNDVIGLYMQIVLIPVCGVQKLFYMCLRFLKSEVERTGNLSENAAAGIPGRVQQLYILQNENWIS